MHQLPSNDEQGSSMGGCHDKDSPLEEEGTHMVDLIDPHAVDFQPLLVSESGTAITYHAHHAPYPNSETETSTNTWMSLERIWQNWKWTLRFQLPSLYWRSSETTTENPRKSNDKYGNVHYVVFGMGVFIFLVVTSNIMDSTTANPMKGTTIAKVSKIKHAQTGTLLPPEIQQAFRNANDLPLGITDTPVFWHVPRSGGTTMKLVMSMCMGRVVACEQGAGHQLEEQLEILNKPFGNFANVDTTTVLGLQRASELGLAQSCLVDVVMTPHVREASVLFDAHHKGRLFTLLREPCERLVSLYYFLRMPNREASQGLNVHDMSLEQFAKDFGENWMVRTLTSTMTGPLEESHLHVAKEVLRTKFLVGLLEEKTETLRRFEAYFGWKLPSRVSQTCKNNMFYFEPQSKNIHPAVDRNSREYQILRNRNKFDVELYDYAKLLFQQQKQLASRGK